MCVMTHNWSATKQHLHLQSVAEISRHSVLSEDRIRQCVVLCNGCRNWFNSSNIEKKLYCLCWTHPWSHNVRLCGSNYQMLTCISLDNSAPFTSFNLADRIRHALAINFRFGLFMSPCNSETFFMRLYNSETAVLSQQPQLFLAGKRFSLNFIDEVLWLFPIML